MDGKNGPLAAEPPVSLSYDISYDKEKIALTPLFHFQPSFNSCLRRETVRRGRQVLLFTFSILCAIVPPCYFRKNFKKASGYFGPSFP